MKLPDKFEAEHIEHLTRYSASRVGVTGDFVVVFTHGSATDVASVREELIINNIVNGYWRITSAMDSSGDNGQAGFSQRLSYFQVHIDAVEENLQSLRQELEKLKREIKEAN